MVQVWHGWVEAVEDDVFLARLTVLRGEEYIGQEVEAEIYRHALLPGDLPWLAPGCYLTWAIGEGRDGTGRSWLRLRRGWPRRVLPGSDPAAAMREALGPLAPTERK